MQDRELYRQILGIESPWKVERVELRRADGEVHVFLQHDEQVRSSTRCDNQSKYGLCGERSCL